MNTHTHTRARAVGRYGVDRACTHTHTHTRSGVSVQTTGGTEQMHAQTEEHTHLSPLTHTHTYLQSHTFPPVHPSSSCHTQSSIFLGSPFSHLCPLTHPPSQNQQQHRLYVLSRCRCAHTHTHPSPPSPVRSCMSWQKCIHVGPRAPRQNPAAAECYYSWIKHGQKRRVFKERRQKKVCELFSRTDYRGPGGPVSCLRSPESMVFLDECRKRAKVLYFITFLFSFIVIAFFSIVPQGEIIARLTQR